MCRQFSFALALVCVVFATGCQNLDHVQFIVPNSSESSLAEVLKSVAERHGMTNALASSTVPQTIANFKVGNFQHYTEIGARRHGESIVIDLMFRKAGAGGGGLFSKIQPELHAALSKLYPGRVRVERNNPIPIL